MTNMTHAICAECKAEFDYDLRPGYPRKYCATCKEIKQQQYEAKSAEFPVVKPGVMQTPAKSPSYAGQSENKNLTMYVSYAKDIFCALYKDGLNANDVMSGATNLVKQAMKELQ